MKPSTLAFILLGIYTLILFCGCVTKHAHVQAPSTAAAQGNVNKAKQSNANAQQANDAATTDVSRIDSKAAVLHKYWPQ